MEMKRGFVNELARQAGISHGYVSNILGGRKSPKYQVAARLASATGTDPVVWMAGEPYRIFEAIEQAEEIMRLRRQQKTSMECDNGDEDDFF